MAIKVGLVGLGKLSGAVSGRPGLWGATAHLPSILHSKEYELVAVANSSTESARQSIASHNLSSEIKAYGTVEDLAADADVDLVVVSVEVGKHFALTKPALLAKKDLYVEWPLGATTAEAEELTALAKKNNVRTIVGLQARSDPLVVKIKEIVRSGKIGSVTSSSVLANISSPTTDAWPAGAAYYLDIKSGGNAFSIFFGHFLDSFTHVLGDFAEVQSILRTLKTTAVLVDDAGNVVTSSYPKTSPDHILVQGVLTSGALASIAYRSTPTTIDGTGYRWVITGTQGEIELTAPESGWQFGVPGATLKVKTKEDGDLEVIKFPLKDIPEHVAKVPVPGTNIAHSYDAFVKDDKARYATFEEAVKNHQLLDRILAVAK